MRTTSRLDDELLKQAKLYAVKSGKSLTAVIENAIRESLTRQPEYRTREPVKLVTFSGAGLHPGVDLYDSSALIDLMDNENDPG